METSTTKKFSFIMSLLTFYIKGRVEVDSNFVKINVPDTFLGLFPYGGIKNTISINQISSVTTGFKIHFLRLFFGIIFTFPALAGLSAAGSGGEFLFSLIWFLLGANIVISSFSTYITIACTSSGWIKIPIFIIENGKPEAIATAINNAINTRLNRSGTIQ